MADSQQPASGSGSAAAESVARLRRLAEELFAHGVAVADPGAAVRGALEVDDRGRTILAGLPVGPNDLVRVVAFGKAAGPMLAAARDVLEPKSLASEPIVSTDRANCRRLPGCRVYCGGHPLPDARSVEAGRAIGGELLGCGVDDAVLVLISGGGSALVSAPVPGITLEEKAETTRLLLESGAPIQDLNAVRKHLSYLKGGGMARLAWPARLHALILSDVVGNDLSVVASGPTVADATTYADALAVIDHYGIGPQTPAGVLNHLRRGASGELPETLPPGHRLFDRVRNVLVGSNDRSLQAVAARAVQLGFEPEIVSRTLVGEATTAGAKLARQLVRLETLPRPIALLAGGETTVTVRGRGRGGRNQELALQFALTAESLGVSQPWAFLSAGTDGRDGPTDAAGAVVDAGTLERGRKAGRDPRRSLKRNDSNRFLAASGDLLETGPTGTNVADLQILLMAPAGFAG